MSFRVRLLLPLLALFVVAVGYPLVYSFYISLTNYKITNRFDVRFTGLDRYADVLHDPDYWLDRSRFGGHMD